MHDGKLYTINRAGVLNCGRASDGEVLWQLRVKGAFWSTPLVADRPLVRGEPGRRRGGGAARRYERRDRGTNAMGESLMASPAAADDALYYRGAKHLWKVKSKQ